jgi:hypothetical protein
MINPLVSQSETPSSSDLLNVARALFSPWLPWRVPAPPRPPLPSANYQSDQGQGAIMLSFQHSLHSRHFHPAPDTSHTRATVGVGEKICAKRRCCRPRKAGTWCLHPRVGSVTAGRSFCQISSASMIPTVFL